MSENGRSKSKTRSSSKEKEKSSTKSTSVSKTSKTSSDSIVTKRDDPSRSSGQSKVNKNGVKTVDSSNRKSKTLEKPSHKVSPKSNSSKDASKETRKTKESMKVTESLQKVPEREMKEPKRESKPVEEAYDYEDDFENYSDDFESDDANEDEKGRGNPKSDDDSDDEDSEEDRDEKAAPNETPVVSSNIPPPIPKAPPVVNKPNTSTTLTKIIPKEEEDEDSPMLRRLNNRDTSRPIEVPKGPQETKLSKPARILSAERKIDFAGTFQGNAQALSEVQRRYQTLKSLIVLEKSTFRFLDQPPIRDYDFYIELFGERGKKQSATQTHDDDVTEESQTEPPEQESRWTQQPAQDDLGWGVEGGTRLTEQETSSQWHVGETDEELARFKVNHLQNERLKHFVEVAGQAIIDLISAKQRKESEYAVMRNRSQLAFSTGYNSFHLGPIAKVSRTVCLTRNVHDKEILLVGFYVEETLAEDLRARSLLAEFLLDHHNAPPKRLFLCEGEASCACYSTDGTVIYGGLRDGSCVAWDLLEASSAFSSSLPWLDSNVNKLTTNSNTQENLVLRTPAYDTSFMATTLRDPERAAAIVDIRNVGGDNSSSSQMAAVDEAGVLSIWTCSRDATRQVSDLGTRPSSRLRLVLTTLLRPDHVVLSSASSPTFLIVNCLTANPLEPTQFLVGTDRGWILNMIRTKGVSYAGPRLYKSDMVTTGEITCQAFSPFEPTILLAGMSSGSISLHRMHDSAPLAILAPPQSSRKSVTHILWSPVCRSLFYSIHAGGRLLTWDVAVGKAPVAICDLNREIPSKVTAACIWLDQRSSQSTGGIAFMALGLIDGEVQIHALEPPKKHESSANSNSTTLEQMCKRLSNNLVS